MKREALIRELRKLAKARNLAFQVNRGAGKGSHYRVYVGDRISTVQSGELSPFHVRRIKQQLGLE